GCTSSTTCSLHKSTVCRQKRLVSCMYEYGLDSPKKEVRQGTTVPPRPQGSGVPLVAGQQALAARANRVRRNVSATDRREEVGRRSTPRRRESSGRAAPASPEVGPTPVTGAA